MGDLDIYTWERIVSFCDFPTVQRVRLVNKQLHEICQKINYQTIVCETYHEWHSDKKLVIKNYKEYTHMKFYEFDEEITFKDTIDGFLEQFNLLYEFIGHYDDLVVHNATKKQVLELIYKMPISHPIFVSNCWLPCRTYEDLFSMVGNRFTVKLKDENFEYYEYPETRWLYMKFVEKYNNMSRIKFDWFYG